MKRNDRGFSLIELTIAGSASIVVVMTAFVALSALQRSGSRQAQAEEVVSGARLAMEVIARDIRSAGDALDLLPSTCLDAAHHIDVTPMPFSCPVILEPHPWRIILARNAWTAADGTRSIYEVDDEPPPDTRAFAEEAENVVMYRFIRKQALPTLADGAGGTRSAHLGRIERVVNPFSFPTGGVAAAPSVTVLLDNVLLDDRMRANPADPTDIDHRYDHALFMYQVLTETGELLGPVGDRVTATGGPYLTPPLRFFPIGPPAAQKNVSPWAADFAAQVVGLEADTTAHTGLLRTGSAGMLASNRDSDLRVILDRNRIRAVRVAFKVVGPERTDIVDGVDIDPSVPGTARIYEFETSVEIKPLAQELAL